MRTAKPEEIVKLYLHGSNEVSKKEKNAWSSKWTEL